MATISREELYALVWQTPMTKLAKRYGISDVALHKICRKHSVPTPPQGYWAKLQHGKPVQQTALPPIGSSSTGHIEIHERAGVLENPELNKVLGRLQEARSEQTSALVLKAEDPLVVTTLAKLKREKRGKSGLIELSEQATVTVHVRPETVARAGELLIQLSEAARQVGYHLEVVGQEVVWRAEQETVSFGIYELEDAVEHIPTDRELRELAKWEAKREADFKRWDYRSDYGRPFIPKWERHFQGRLEVRLEEVRDRTGNEYWGPMLRRKFADAKNRDVMKAIPKVVEAIAAIAVTKAQNREADEARRVAREEAENRRREAERLAALERGRSDLLRELLEEDDACQRLEALIGSIEANVEVASAPRVQGLITWCRARLGSLNDARSPLALEQRLRTLALFEDQPGAT